MPAYTPHQTQDHSSPPPTSTRATHHRIVVGRGSPVAVAQRARRASDARGEKTHCHPWTDAMGNGTPQTTQSVQSTGKPSLVAKNNIYLVKRMYVRNAQNGKRGHCHPWTVLYAPCTTCTQRCVAAYRCEHSWV